MRRSHNNPALDLPGSAAARHFEQDPRAREQVDMCCEYTALVLKVIEIISFSTVLRKPELIWRVLTERPSLVCRRSMIGDRSGKRDENPQSATLLSRL